jgi:hypothetical protein
MLRILSARCLIVMTMSAVPMSVQVYPYRDGTPGVSGYRSEVMAEVMIQESEFVRLAEAIPPTNIHGVLPQMYAPSPKFSCTPALPTITSTNSWALPLRLRSTPRPV